jgi:hypothetical protein
MDPADPPPPETAPIAYDEGFLLHDHNVRTDAGAPLLWPGDFLPINFSFPEDENRNGMFDAEELARVGLPPMPTDPIRRRLNNWETFVRRCAESLRLVWNRNHPSYALSGRAIAVVTSGDRTDSTAQNRTGWEGSAGPGETAFWASVNIDGNGYLPHETGHTFGFALPGNGHTDDPPAGSPPGTSGPSCAFSDEAINLLTRRIVNPGFSLMCSGVDLSSALFLTPAEYNRLFDLLVRAWEV